MPTIVPPVDSFSISGGAEPAVDRRPTVELCPGDVLAFTDGVPEAHNPENEEFGEERLQQQLRQTAHLPANEIGGRLSGEMKDWIRDAEHTTISPSS